MDNLGLFLFIFGVSGQSKYLDFIMILGAEYVIYLTLILIFVLAIKGKVSERKALIVTLFAFPVLVIIIKIIHLFFYEPRPFVTLDISPLVSHKDDASFPSRHTTVMSAIAFSYIYFKSKWFPIFVFLLVWVGISRVFVGVHYPFDIIGGMLVGVISGLIALKIINLISIRFFR